MHKSGSPNGPSLGAIGNLSSSTLSRTPLGIVPEKAVLGTQIRRTVPAQYWGVSLASASAPDGASASSVSDAAPLPLLMGSGLSRPHLVLATQAIKLPGRPSLPGLPSVCHSQGGVVLDRIIAHSSGDTWWAALSGRARLGRLVAQRADLLAAAADPGSYSLCATSRVQLRRNTVLRARLNWCSPITASSTSKSWLGRRCAPRNHPIETSDTSAIPTSAGASAQGSPTQSGWAAVPLSFHSQVQSRIGRWAEVRADLAAGQRTACCAVNNARNGTVKDKKGSGSPAGPAQVDPGQKVLGTAADAGVVTPLLIGLQAGSVPSSRSPLVWRCGVLQVTAPRTVPLTGSAAAAGGACQTTASAMQSAVYVQGTVALQGERVLWQGPKQPLHRRSRKDEGNGASIAATDGLGPTSSSPSSGPFTVPSAMAAPPTASSGPGAFGLMRKGTSGYPILSAAADEDDEDFDEDDDEGATATGPGDRVNSAMGNAGKMLRSSRSSGAGPAGSGVVSLGGGGSGGSGSAAAGGTAAAAPFSIELPTAGSVQEALADITQSVSRLRDDVTAAAKWVGDGGMVEQLTAAAASASGAASKRKAAASRKQEDSGVAQVPWSSFVSEPHVKVAGMVGVTARAPVIVLTHGSAASKVGAAGCLVPVRRAWVQDLGISHLLRRRNRSGTPQDSVDAEEVDHSAALAPASRGALRPFASAAASVQAGRFTGWFMDFTRVSAQLDCGLWGPDAKSCEDGSARSSTARQRHPAFALGDTGAWHAVSLSLSQQLLGPLRFVADWRYQLASSNPLALPPPPHVDSETPNRGAAGTAAAAGSWLGGAAGALTSHMGGMRPQLLEAVYGLDLSLPGSRGAARLVTWYSPQRREGMVELRMF